MRFDSESQGESLPRGILHTAAGTKQFPTLSQHVVVDTESECKVIAMVVMRNCDLLKDKDHMCIMIKLVVMQSDTEMRRKKSPQEAIGTYTVIKHKVC